MDIADSVSVERIDDILTALSNSNTPLSIWNIATILYPEPPHGNIPNLLITLNYLCEERFVYRETLPDRKEDEDPTIYILSLRGRNLVAHHGYRAAVNVDSETHKRIGRLENWQIILTALVGVGSFGFLLWEILKYFYLDCH
jgi:hypothetical protein